MPTNELRSEAARLLAQAQKLHEAGCNVEAHELTMQATNCLEDAVIIESFRLKARRKTSVDLHANVVDAHDEDVGKQVSY